MENKTISGSKGVGVTFAPVSKDAIDIQDIKVVGYTAGEFEDVLKISLLDTRGRATAEYFWADIAGETPEGNIYGWLDADEAVAEGVAIKAGDGVWVYSDNAAISLVLPGVEIK